MASESSARERVFATPELLEAILVQLPQRDLLFAQRISRHFHKAISSSPRLQHLLFFRAGPSRKKRALDVLYRLPFISASSTKTRKSWTLNPLLQERFVPWLVLPGNRWAMPEYQHLEMLDGLDTESKREAFLRQEAGWRRMLLVQPPPKTLSVIRFCHAMGGDSASEATVPFEDSTSGGVTMGVIYDITESFLRDHTVSQFGLSILDSESAAPRISLYLVYTSQCCPDYTPRKVSLQSKGAEVLERDLKFNRVEGSVFRKRLDMDWNSDLTVEKGGVNHVDFEVWQRKRAPISSLLSDVR